MQIRRQSFETKSVKSEGYFSELKKTLSGANTLAKLGDRMMVVLSGPESIASTFYRLVYTSDKLGVEQHSKRQNSLNLIGLTQIKPKSANDNFFYMLGFSPNNVMKIFAIDRDYTKDNLQSIGWSGRAFGCYRTLCEGAKINAIFYDEKFKKHLLIADGGLITLENLFNINGMHYLYASSSSSFTIVLMATSLLFDIW